MSASASQPLVSVIVPVFNGARYLRESIDSILGQTYSNVEVLVMDDASTDETPQVIASYGDSVRAVRQTGNKGIYENANVGIELARGEFIAVYHADDIYLPTIIEREVEVLLRHPEVGAVFASDIFVDAAGREYGRLVLPREVSGNRPLDYSTILNALLRYNNTFLRCPGAMVRASVYADVGTYRQNVYRNTADLDMWLRIASRYPLLVLEEHLFKYRHFHGSSAERYHHLRTAPSRTLVILEDYLRAGGRAFARPDALAAFEALRAEDTLKRAISHYVLDELAESRRCLAQVSLRNLLGSARVRRARLAVLWAAMQLLARVARSATVAEVFRRRWHTRGGSRPDGAR